MTVDFLPFATAGGANVESQAAYAADPTTSTGFFTGIAQSQKLNKVWRQSSFVSSAIANLIANVLSINVLDDGNLSGFITNLTNAITTLAWTNAALTGTATAPTVPGSSDNSTKIATTAFVQACIAVVDAAIALLAPLASPAFTGVPTAPTPASNDNSTKIATTAWFWNAILNVLGAQVSTAGLGLAWSAGNATQTFAHGLSVQPVAFDISLTAVNSVDGYTAGQTVMIIQGARSSDAAVGVAADATNVKWSVGTDGITIMNLGGGNTVNIVNSTNFTLNIVAKAYY